MNITINIVEVASELAGEIISNIFDDDDKIYQEIDGELSYTDNVQKIFDEWYDHYYNFLQKREIK
jgi:hypothetical protein